ncbi:brachyurin-like, partial [Culex pipiens pallens]|uniref:brachyurin-like n=1 Tax=Culex pipiens pallens TaxID=42434 RepID=UPI0022A9FA2B
RNASICPSSVDLRNTMQALAILSLCLSVAFAVQSPDVDPQSIDWSTVRTLRETDRFRAKFGLAPLSDDEIRSSRISGGTVASPTDIPWAAGILINQGTSSQSFCTGVLISAKFVLTAASCVSRGDIVSVALNAADMNAIGTLIPVTTIFPHPNYSWLLRRDDIAMLTLSRDAPVDGLTVRPVELPRRSDVGKTFVGQTATTAGWGNTGNRDNEPIPTQHLQFAMDSVTSNLVCQTSHDWVRSTHICVATNNGGACNGDEGAPVTVLEAGRGYLIGIHSFHYSGLRGCDRGRSTVNTRVTEYLDWIAENSDVTIQP